MRKMTRRNCQNAIAGAVSKSQPKLSMPNEDSCSDQDSIMRLRGGGYESEDDFRHDERQMREEQVKRNALRQQSDQSNHEADRQEITTMQELQERKRRKKNEKNRANKRRRKAHKAHMKEMVRRSKKIIYDVRGSLQKIVEGSNEETNTERVSVQTGNFSQDIEKLNNDQSIITNLIALTKSRDKNVDIASKPTPEQAALMQRQEMATLQLASSSTGQGIPESLVDREACSENHAVPATDYNVTLHDLTKKVEEKTNELECVSKELDEKRNELQCVEKELLELTNELECVSKELDEKRNELQCVEK